MTNEPTQIGTVLASGERATVSASLPPGLPPGLPPELSWCSIPPNLRATLENVVKVPRWPLVLWGEAGRGKTCAMGCLYQRWRGHRRWWSTAGFVSDIQKILRSRDGYILRRVGCENVATYESTMWATIESRDAFVCLDDFGLREASASAYEILHRLLDLRAGKPTCITSNINPGEFTSVYDQRIASRVLAGTQIEVTGEDLRLRGSRRLRA